MQNPLERSQGNKDERVNGIEDSPMMTIEYLRARLLAERSVSRAAKERADELAKRVTELEEQLKVVTLQRKRTEKATLDIISYLASHGVGDISEVYESESDQEESLCESNAGKHEEETYVSSEMKGNDKEYSGSDHDSTRSSSRSLSWKGRKETTRHFEKKYLDPSMRRRTNLAQFSSSPRQHPGKSCRQIKRREMRSAVEESRHDSVKSDTQDNSAANSLDNLANCLGTGDEESKRLPEKWVQKCFQKNEALLSHPRECDASSSHKHKSSGDMERALEHQAQLIGCYEAQEKAQRDWEEKYGENNSSSPDSCEPGNHSDVTEERDENKAAVPRSTEIIAGHGHDQKAGIDFQSRKPPIAHFNSFKLTPHNETGSSQNQNFSEMKASIPSPDFAFSVNCNNQTQESCADSSFRIPQEPHRLGAVLGALQEVKSLIKRQMTILPQTSESIGRATETPASAVSEGDLFKVPVGCPGLFRLPTDLQPQATQSRLLGSDYSSELTNFSHYSGTPALQGNQYGSRPTNLRFSRPGADTFSSWPVIGTKVGVSDRQSRLEFNFSTSQPESTKSMLPPYSSVPDFFPCVSSNQISFGPRI